MARPGRESGRPKAHHALVAFLLFFVLDVRLFICLHEPENGTLIPEVPSNVTKPHQVAKMVPYPVRCPSTPVYPWGVYHKTYPPFA